MRGIVCLFERLIQHRYWSLSLISIVQESTFQRGAYPVFAAVGRFDRSLFWRSKPLPVSQQGGGLLSIGLIGLGSRKDLPKFYRPAAGEVLAVMPAEPIKVSNGSVESVIFQGGLDCGWFAAVAECLLCLRVKVLDAKDTCLYWQGVSDGGGSDSAQIIVIFDMDHTKDAPIDNRFQIVNRSFRLPCNGSFPDYPHDKEKRSGMFGMGRSPWSSILGTRLALIWKFCQLRALWKTLLPFCRKVCLCTNRSLRVIIREQCIRG